MTRKKAAYKSWIYDEFKTKKPKSKLQTQLMEEDTTPLPVDCGKITFEGRASIRFD